MKTALIQMLCVPDKAANLARARELVAAAAADGADMVCLPEMFCCEYRSRAMREAREPAGGPVWTALSRMAEQSGVYLIGGSFPEECGDRLYNSSFVFDRAGRQIARHRKMHLFDIDVRGRQRFRESDVFSAGGDVTVFDTEFGKMGLVICFDIRFPELSRLTALSGAQVVFCPAAFNMTTGPAHWELMFRARASENQVFFCACAPARDESGSYVSYANSMVCSPWGDVQARAGAEETVLTADIDLSRIDDVRGQLPLMSARRSDVYELRLRRNFGG